ncbi:MAG: hypothetical protein KY450_05950 [Actinobacteria bacterium]|nr:hypothetical protein [Actinomycetota bacterium]
MVAFVLSRLAVAASGVRFDAGPLASGFQVLELSELRDDLLGSLAHLHSQPPLFNLLIGLVLRVPQAWEESLLRMVYLGAGLALALTVYMVLVRLGVRSAIAVVLTLVLALSPANILFENWSHYDYLVILLLCLSVLTLQRYETGHRLRHVALFLGLLAVLVLTRSTFQLIWFLAWAVVLVVHRRRADWKKVATVAAVPLLVIVAVYANTLRVTGAFTSSTSLGVSLAKITTFQLPEAERRAMVGRGELSPLALIPPFTPVPGYRDVVPSPPRTGVPVLDDEMKTFADGSSWINFNNLIYAGVSQAYLDDALRTLRAHPDAYLGGVAAGTEMFFRPPSDFFALRDNRLQLGAFNHWYNRVIYGVVANGEPVSVFPDVGRQYRQGPPRTAWLSVLLYGVAVVGGAVELSFARRRRGGAGSLVLAFLWSTVLYVTAVSNLLEVGENERFRLYTDPLVLLLLAALAMRWRSRRKPEAPAMTAPMEPGSLRRAT